MPSIPWYLLVPLCFFSALFWLVVGLMLLGAVLTALDGVR